MAHHDRRHAPPRRQGRDEIAATPFAGAYKSVFTVAIPAAQQGSMLALLGHVNCNYLSTKGTTPTLTQLKQHAQCLTNLIRHNTLSDTQGVVDSAREGVPVFGRHSAFDWLNDLSTPYENEDAHHNQPLTTLGNLIEPVSADPDEGDRDICPLHHAAKSPPNGPSLPYATHEALIAHANEVLELLDHEYSAKGGLNALLPPEEQREERKAAEATLLGQLILYQQRLVQRLHDLERSYANALDVLAGEAVVPHQSLSILGPDGRSGREIVYPQDRFVLANAGEDLWGFLSHEFDKKDYTESIVRRSYRDKGLEGHALWRRDGGVEYDRGITAIDVYTRYYRLRGGGAKTVFIIPAYESHPGTKVTREIEKQPTVVAVVKPVWPERASTWEMKKRAELQDLRDLRLERTGLYQKIEDLEKTQIFLTDSLQRTESRLRDTEKAAREMEDITKLGVTRGHKANLDRMSVLVERTARLDEREKELDGLRTSVASKEADLNRRLAELVEQRLTDGAAHTNRQRELAAEHDARVELLLTEREIAAKAASQVHRRFKDRWVKQITETQVLVNFLNSAAVQARLGGLTIPDEVQKRGEAQALQMLDQMDPDGAIERAQDRANAAAAVKATSSWMDIDPPVP
ncbi:hypothetical protein B7494_g4700 [Chlorociboria aeruginascens]|nr:hypothetical protein B7494_g4700 [Chlorociboria aeruginascens]